jgi:hypothetical protein
LSERRSGRFHSHFFIQENSASVDVARATAAKKSGINSAFRQPRKLGNVTVEFALLRQVLFLLRRHFRRIICARKASGSKLSASDLVFREPLFFMGSAFHL